jgi:predicted MFS family arabinose efflux permease
MLFAKERYKPKKKAVLELLKDTTNNGKLAFRFIGTNKIILLLVIAGVFAELMMVGNAGWQPWLVNLGIAEHHLGYMFSIMSRLVMVTPFLSRLFVKFQTKNAVSIILGIRMILLLTVSLIYPPFYLIAGFIFIFDSGFRSMGNPILQTYYHKFIPTKIRATTVSSINMIGQLTLAITSIIAGYCMDLFGPQKVIAFGAVFGVFAIVVYQMIKE